MHRLFGYVEGKMNPKSFSLAEEKMCKIPKFFVCKRKTFNFTLVFLVEKKNLRSIMLSVMI